MVSQLRLRVSNPPIVIPQLRSFTDVMLLLWGNNRYYEDGKKSCFLSYQRSCAKDDIVNTGGCIHCSSGWEVQQNEVCTKCDAGKYNDEAGGACKSCPRGRFGSAYDIGNDALSDCKTCGQGYFCEGGLHRDACPAGKYTDSINAQYSSHCKDCPNGKYSESSGISLVQCKNCDRGYKCEEGKKTLCEKGTYQSEESKDYCNNCPMGFYCESGSHIQGCAAGRYGDGSNYKYASKDKETELHERVYYCKDCPSGNWCSGEKILTLCAAGKYSMQAKQVSENACITCEGKRINRYAELKCIIYYYMLLNTYLLVIAVHPTL